MSSDNSKKDVENAIPVERDDIVNWAANILENQRSYRNMKLLGSGTFGDVRFMFDIKTNTSIAVKIVKANKVSEAELTLWPSLHHPNVVPLLELLVLGENREVSVFVMPAQSKTLIGALKEWYIVQLGNVPSWLHDILLGLEYLHSKDLCHLDIKADNVLISDTKVAKICDFTFLNETTKTLNRSHVGSPLIYDPPEACKSLGPGVTVDGKACDMWCFGIMCLEVLTKFQLQFEKADGEYSWLKNVYPSIFKLLQEGNFFQLMDAAFLAAKIDSAYSQKALDFLHGFLRIDSDERVKVEKARQHSFLKRGTVTGQPPDSFWVHKVTADAEGCQIFKKICAKIDPKEENTYTEEGETKNDIELETSDDFCNRDTREIEPEIPENEEKQNFSDDSSVSSDEDSEISENDDKRYCSKDSSVLNDKNRIDFMEGEENGEGKIDETSFRSPNSDTIDAFASSSEDGNTSKTHKTCQKRRPGITKIARWMLKRFRGGRQKERKASALEGVRDSWNGQIEYETPHSVSF